MTKINRTIIFSLILMLSTAVFAQDRPDALKEYKNKNYQLAVDICMAEIKNKPDSIDSYLILGWSLIKLGQYGEAVKWAETGLKYVPNDMRLVETLGEAFYFCGDNQKAMKNLCRYAADVPSGAYIDNVYYYMGEIYIRMGEYNNADIALTTALYHYPNNAAWWSRLGYAREMAESLKSSLEAYEHSLQINPSYTEATRGKTRVQSKLDS